MALNWMDFSWTIKRWLGLRPQDFSASLPTSTPASGNYTITDSDYSLVSTNSSNVTWTLPTTASAGQTYRVKVQGAGEVTLSGNIFTDAATTTLTLGTGDMVSLRYDGSYWNVGD